MALASIPPTSPRFSVRLLLATWAILLGGTAAALSGSPVELSGSSPFANCQPTEFGTNFPNSETEPAIAVNPLDSQHMVAGWQQDRWSTGGSLGLVTALTKDGGKSWRSVVVPGISKCSGGTGDFAYDRASDLSLAISPNGTAFATILSFDVGPPRGGAGKNAVMVSRSTDGGLHWDQPTMLARNDYPSAFLIAPAITTDPRDPRYAYATWSNFYDRTGLESNNLVTFWRSYPDGGEIARRLWRKVLSAYDKEKESYFGGSAYLARTTDFGRSWETVLIRNEFYPVAGTARVGTQPIVLGDGSVLVFFTYLSQGPTTIRFARSTDHGSTFGGPRPFEQSELVAEGLKMSVTGTLTPDTMNPVRDRNPLFDVAVDPVNDNLYVVWQAQNPDGGDNIAFTMSRDKGKSWSPPVIVNNTPRNAKSPLHNQAFLPSVEVVNSWVFVSYYDFRNDRPKTKGSELVDACVVSCTPAAADCSQRQAWGNEVRLTTKSFDILKAPPSTGLYLGDHQDLVRQGNSLRGVFGVTTSTNKSSIMTSVVP